jgi:hypothetical protein
MTTHCLLCALFGSIVLAGAVRADEFWVDGRTGRDDPSRGRTAQEPWRTIGYALRQIGTPADGGHHTLFVAGDQVYSGATNGETFPLRLPPRIGLVGTGNCPALGIDPGAVGIDLEPTDSYDRDTRIENVGFDGGAVGLRMKADRERRHGPLVVGCGFWRQSVAGLQVDGATQFASFNDPLVVRCQFAHAPCGIDAGLGFGTPSLTLETVECAFHDLSASAIDILASSGSSSAVVIRRCSFDRCRHGLTLNHSSLGAATTEVFGSSFREYEIGVSLLSFESLPLLVEDCSFVGRAGSTGIEVFANFGLMCEARRNAFHGGSIGMSFPVDSLRLTLEDNLVRGCTTGLLVDVLGGMGIDSRRNRFLDNDIGVSLRARSGPDTVDLESGLFAGNRSGIVTTRIGSFHGRSLTFADNRGAALQVTGFVPPQAVLDHCIFSENQDDVSGPATITWSAFKDRSYPGHGNLQVDPQLIRPSYKLAPTSPCIDAGNAALPLAATDYEGDPRVVRGPKGLLPDLGADEFVPSGSAHTYGVGGFGRHGFVPAIATPNTEFVIGTTLQVALQDALDDQGRAADFAALMVGATETSGLLPFELEPYGAPASFLWQDVLAVDSLVPVATNGTAGRTLAIPAEPQLVGRVTTFQWAVMKPGANPLGLVTTQGLRVTFGGATSAP